MVITILTSISVAMCVFILHLHRLGARHAHVPPWLFRLVTRYIARFVGLSYILKHYQQPHRVDLEPEERPLRIDYDDLTARYKLIQVEGNGLYILARDGDGPVIEKEDKEEINDLHRVNEHRGRVLKAMKAVIVDGSPLSGARAGRGVDEIEGAVSGLRHPEVVWQDIAEVIDRLFFWLCFFTISISTLSLLVIVPLSKPDTETLMSWEDGSK